MAQCNMSCFVVHLWFYLNHLKNTCCEPDYFFHVLKCKTLEATEGVLSFGQL